MDFALEVKNLTKQYDDFTLNQITLSIPSGTVVGLVGENGAGKSTFLHSVTGILHSSYDTLKVLGKDFETNEKEIKEDVAVIFDTTHYNLSFTPKFIGLILSKTYKNWNMETYYHYLELFGLPLEKKLKTFSRGMKMKLEFAIAFSHNAKFLILDEATSGLDPVVRDDILNILRDFTLQEDHTVLLSSHITSDLEKISDYIAYIHQGNLLFMIPYEELHEKYGIIHAGKDFFDSLNPEDVIGYIEEPYSFSILVKNRFAIQEVFQDLEIARATIEDIMLFYVKGKK